MMVQEIDTKIESLFGSTVELRREVARIVYEHPDSNFTDDGTDYELILDTLDKVYRELRDIMP